MKQGKFDLVAGDPSTLHMDADRAETLALRADTGRVNPRRAKIICTVGPASNSEATLRDLLRLGMDVARLNFSHGAHEDHARNIARIRKAARKEGRTVGILQDLQGPKIRTGRLRSHEPVMLKTGSLVTITPRDVVGTPTLIATTFHGLAREVVPGARVLLSDGLIELRVRRLHGEDVECVVVNGGLLGQHQGINLPGVALTIPALTEKDRKDLEFGLKHDVDLVAISFVRSASDVREVRELILDQGGDVPVIAKLEKPQALEQLEEIFEAADGVMVARGDLGVEMLPEQVPIIQKHVIRRAAEWRKPVIIATQMLESMIENPRPTRAEASDVANAIFDGTDAVMLSAETASGKYPVEAVDMMARIIEEAEASITEFPRPVSQEQLKVAETVAELVCHASRELHMKLIAVFTHSGFTARLVSRYRPLVPIVAFSPEAETRRRMALIWGVLPRSIQDVQKVDGLAPVAEKRLLQERLVRKGDVIGIVAGTPMGIRGTTNFMKFHVIGGPA